ncbi:MAG TPA: hypothetical protein VKR42_01725 [Ktedonobacteraceae bacterium]|nr:hypothetical protein [Ktedonobacteraceae bacterium]
MRQPLPLHLLHLLHLFRASPEYDWRNQLRRYIGVVLVGTLTSNGVIATL